MAAFDLRERRRPDPRDDGQALEGELPRLPFRAQEATDMHTPHDRWRLPPRPSSCRGPVDARRSLAELWISGRNDTPFASLLSGSGRSFPDPERSRAIGVRPGGVTDSVEPIALVRMARQPRCSNSDVAGRVNESGRWSGRCGAARDGRPGWRTRRQRKRPERTPGPNAGERTPGPNAGTERRERTPRAHVESERRERTPRAHVESAAATATGFARCRCGLKLPQNPVEERVNRCGSSVVSRA
jgi:hypothetical protein